MNLVRELENISDNHRLDYNRVMNVVYFKGIDLIISLLMLLSIISPRIDDRLLAVIFILGVASKIGTQLLISGTDKFLSFKEDFVCWRFLLSSSKKQKEIQDELKAYLEAKYAPPIPKKGFCDSPALLDDEIKLTEWVAKYVRKETSIINHFVSRFGNPMVKDMYFIRLLIWSQLIPIKKLDINDLRMVLAANPDLNNEVLKANSTPLLIQADLNKIFSHYSSQDLTILLTGDFSIENYLNVIKRSHKMGVELPVMKSIRDLVKYLHFLEEKDFVIKEWQNKVTDNNHFEFTEAITTKESLLLHKAYFKNCIETYTKRLGAGEGMLFVAYKQGQPHIVFYVDEKLKLGDATYRFNKPVSKEDKKILQNICSKA